MMKHREKNSLNFDIGKCVYRAMVGTGGIGSGWFFALDGNHTLGREESRSGHFIDRLDYCKLHIVSHYVKMLLGSEFQVIPVGMVGDDEIGQRLLEEMREVGLDTMYVEKLKDAGTLFSFCFVYPDGSGGNMTIHDSASGKVSEAFVIRSEKQFKHFKKRGIALAVPEAPLSARKKLLELGTDYAFFRVASFTTGEMAEVRETGILRNVDLLALNLDEAEQVAEFLHEGEGAEAVVKSTLDTLSQLYPHLCISVTAGKQGSWTWDRERLSYVPAFEAEAVSTAGAGDAFLAGLVSGITVGLSLPEAQGLATLVASLSVTSPHTIHKGINKESLQKFADEVIAPLPERVKDLL